MLAEHEAPMSVRLTIVEWVSTTVLLRTNRLLCAIDRPEGVERPTMVIIYSQRFKVRTVS